MLYWISNAMSMYTMQMSFTFMANCVGKLSSHSLVAFVDLYTTT